MLLSPEEIKVVFDWNKWLEACRASTERHCVLGEDCDFTEAELLDNEMFGSIAIGFFMGRGMSSHRAYELVYCSDVVDR